MTHKRKASTPINEGSAEIAKQHKKRLIRTNTATSTSSPNNQQADSESTNLQISNITVGPATVIVNLSSDPDMVTCNIGFLLVWLVPWQHLKTFTPELAKEILQSFEPFLIYFFNFCIVRKESIFFNVCLLVKISF